MRVGSRSLSNAPPLSIDANPWRRPGGACEFVVVSIPAVYFLCAIAAVILRVQWPWFQRLTYYGAPEPTQQAPAVEAPSWWMRLLQLPRRILEKQIHKGLGFTVFYLVGLASWSVLTLGTFGMDHDDMPPFGTAWTLYRLHLTRRAVESLFITKSRREATMSLFGLLSGASFYIMAPIAVWTATPFSVRSACLMWEGREDIPPAPFADAPWTLAVLVWIGLNVIAQGLQFRAHAQLAKHGKEDPHHRTLPITWMFALTPAPHYLAEMFIYGSIGLVSVSSGTIGKYSATRWWYVLPTFLAAIFTAANLSITLVEKMATNGWDALYDEAGESEGDDVGEGDATPPPAPPAAKPARKVMQRKPAGVPPVAPRPTAAESLDPAVEDHEKQE